MHRWAALPVDPTVGPDPRGSSMPVVTRHPGQAPEKQCLRFCISALPLAGYRQAATTEWHSLDRAALSYSS